MELCELEGLLTSNEGKAAREQLTLIRIFEELRDRGYDGGYDAVRRYAGHWPPKLRMPRGLSTSVRQANGTAHAHQAVQKTEVGVATMVAAVGQTGNMEQRSRL